MLAHQGISKVGYDICILVWGEWYTLNSQVEEKTACDFRCWQLFIDHLLQLLLSKLLIVDCLLLIDLLVLLLLVVVEFVRQVQGLKIHFKRGIVSGSVFIDKELQIGV